MIPHTNIYLILATTTDTERQGLLCCSGRISYSILLWLCFSEPKQHIKHQYKRYIQYSRRRRPRRTEDRYSNCRLFSPSCRRSGRVHCSVLLAYKFSALQGAEIDIHFRNDVHLLYYFGEIKYYYISTSGIQFTALDTSSNSTATAKDTIGAY